MGKVRMPKVVYYNEDSDNFHNAMGVGMGAAFWQSWHHLKSVFPTSEGSVSDISMTSKAEINHEILTAVLITQEVFERSVIEKIGEGDVSDEAMSLVLQIEERLAELYQELGKS